MRLLQRTAQAMAIENGTVDWERVEFPILRINLSKIHENPYQPRLLYDAQSIVDLAINILRISEDIPATSGLQQIPMARVMRQGQADESQPLPKAYYADIDALHRTIDEENITVQLCFGHRRFKAFQVLAEGVETIYPTLINQLENIADLMRPNASYQTMPLQLIFAENPQMWQHSVTENAQRKDISAIEEALTIQQAMNEFGLTTEQAGSAFGWRRTTTANKLRLLKLPKPIQDAIAQNELSEKHGRLLLHLEVAPDLLNRVYDRLSQNEMSTRELDKYISQQIEQCPPVPDSPVVMTYQGIEEEHRLPWLTDWSPKVSGVRVCQGCSFRVQLKKEEGHRCVEVADGEQGVCYQRKLALWAEQSPQPEQVSTQGEPEQAANHQAVSAIPAESLHAEAIDAPQIQPDEQFDISIQHVALDLPQSLIPKLLTAIRESRLSDDEKRVVADQLSRWVP